MKALAAALFLATAALAAQDGGPAPAPAHSRHDAGAIDGGSADPDAEVIENLDALERLDLLEHLELFDSGGN